MGRPWAFSPLDSFRLVANRFNVVAIGVKHERAVVGRVIHGADTGRTVVRAAGADRGLVESVNLGAAVGCERDMDARRGLAGSCQSEKRLAVRAEPRDIDIARHRLREFHQYGDPSGFSAAM